VVLELGPGAPSDRRDADRLPTLAPLSTGHPGPSQVVAPRRPARRADNRSGWTWHPLGDDGCSSRRSWPAGTRCGALVRRASLRWTAGKLTANPGCLSTPAWPAAMSKRAGHGT